MLRDLSRLARSLAGSLGAGEKPDEGAAAIGPAAQPAPAASALDRLGPVVGHNHERRAEERHMASVMGRLRLPASEHDCEIVDLSTGGMSVLTPDAPVSVGMQVSVAAQSLPRLLGIVRWTAENSCGVQFARPLPDGVIETMGRLKRRVRQPRANRLRLALPCTVYFDGVQHNVLVENISVGGMMISAGLPTGRGPKKPIRRGQALMIQFPDLLPIGGHVRWTCGDQYGVMFSKLLKLSIAEELRRLGNLSHAWLDEVREAHSEADALEKAPPATEAPPEG